MRALFAVFLLVGLLALPAGAAEPAAFVPLPSPPPTAELGPPVPVAQDTCIRDPGPRWSVNLDYLLWFLREGRLPATLTTSSQASRGLLGQPDTRTLYGDDRLETRHGDKFNGVKLTLGFWLDDARTVGVEGNAFFLERDSTYFKAVSDGSTLLARPYFNPDGSPASFIIAGQTPTGPRSGGFVGYSRIELFGQEVNLVAPLSADDTVRLEALGGARFLQLRDRTDLTASGRALSGKELVFGLEDHFRTENAYYGAQAGLRGELTAGRWSLQLRGVTGLGANTEQVRAFGSSLVQTPAERSVTPTGLSVQTGNRGTFERTAVSWVSEVGCAIGFRVTPNVRVFGGYTFLLWDSPVRSGDQIDPVINTNPGTPPARPLIPFKEDRFWAQGLNLGLEFGW
jgi:hypothetical protein